MGIVQCCNIVSSLFPMLEKIENRVFVLPHNFPAVLVIFAGRGGEPPLLPPTVRGGAGRPSLILKPQSKSSKHMRTKNKKARARALFTFDPCNSDKKSFFVGRCFLNYAILLFPLELRGFWPSEEELRRKRRKIFREGKYFWGKEKENILFGGE